ncbi:MAG: hypothetical protein ACP5UV_06515 [Thermoplasmata archaeon]
MKVDDSIIKALGTRVTVAIVMLVALANSAMSAIGTLEHTYTVNGVKVSRFYAVPLTYDIAYVTIVFAVLSVYSTTVFLIALRHVKQKMKTEKLEWT